MQHFVFIRNRTISRTQWLLNLKLDLQISDLTCVICSWFLTLSIFQKKVSAALHFFSKNHVEIIIMQTVLFLIRVFSIHSLSKCWNEWENYCLEFGDLVSIILSKIWKKVVKRKFLISMSSVTLTFVTNYVQIIKCFLLDFIIFS